MTRTSEGRIHSGRSAGVRGAKHPAAPRLKDAMKYDHKDAEGFIRLFSLPERVRAITREGRGK